MGVRFIGFLLGLGALWNLVTTNARLTGLVKFSSALASDLSLQAEIPLQGENEFPLRLEQTCLAFSAAFNLPLNGHGDGTGGPSETMAPDLPTLVENAGWRCASRRADRCTVALDTLRGARTALIMPHRGRIRVGTELASWDSLSKACREAVARLLLSANARLRLARAVVIEEEEGGGAAQLEVVFEGTVSPAEMRCALEALSVGAELCAPAAEMLQHETAAELFLALRGGPREREDSQHTTERKSQV